MSLKKVQLLEEERLDWMAATLDSVSDLVFIADLEDRFLYANPAALLKLGYSIEEMLGRTAVMIMSEDTMKKREEMLSCTLGAPYTWEGEVRNVKKDGSIFTAHLKTALIRDKHGKSIGMVGIERDITEHKVRERLAAIGALAAGLAHEIGNPLASISSVIQLLQRKTQDAYMTQQLQTLITHVHRIHSIIQNVSDFAKKDQPQFMAVDLKFVIENCLQKVCLERNPKRVHIQSHIERQLPRVKAEAEQLSIAFYHIFMNAFDAIANEGYLIVKAHSEKNSVLIDVEDSGCGISREHLKRVFEPFFTTKDIGKGQGLGLSVSYGLIKSFGGDVQMESIVGQGTKIRILLPIYK
ncbi:MAG: PAS domain S-box protein [Deltaproteobacteria bacterium]|nr:PAS domain S-box protein [Deltaproteobacteria bacterium]